VKPLPPEFFDRPADVVAPDLLGATIISTLDGAVTSGRIVETEAYLGLDDPASHGYRGRRHAGNLSLYASPGTWYVYRSYGIHWCANLVTGGPAPGAAVLLRAVIPVGGIEEMRRRRGGMVGRILTNGPGKLCQALGVTGALDGQQMNDSPVLVGKQTQRPVGRFSVTPRIGITKAADRPLRFLMHPLLLE
jgi:DNA-3-methyladenine glycosylase